MKGQHRGYDRMAIELDHNGTGFQQTGATTTVFVVWLPHKSTMAVFGFLNVMMLVEAYSDWQRHGAILRCHPATPIGSYLQGWKAVAYAASLAAPLLIALKALYTMITGRILSFSSASKGCAGRAPCMGCTTPGKPWSPQCGKLAKVFCTSAAIRQKQTAHATPAAGHRATLRWLPARRSPPARRTPTAWCAP